MPKCLTLIALLKRSVDYCFTGNGRFGISKQFCRYCSSNFEMSLVDSFCCKIFILKLSKFCPEILFSSFLTLNILSIFLLVLRSALSFEGRSGFYFFDGDLLLLPWLDRRTLILFLDVEHFLRLSSW